VTSCNASFIIGDEPITKSSSLHMASVAKKVQNKIFGRSTTPTPDDPQQERPDLGLPPLTIEIPGASAASTHPRRSDPLSARDQPRSAQPIPSYRERLAKKLGADYNGVERYRLEQDDKREKHWKRWGPYLSDRQWVNTPPFPYILALMHRAGYCARRLF